MKQILQNLKTGTTDIIEVPAPICKPGHLLIATQRSLISAGTERMLVEFGQANLVAKARAQPDKVKQVLDKMRTDGLLPTLETVFARLDQPLPLGYCNAGVVLEVGAGVEDFTVGDRVISNGPHAEIVCVPKNLCAKIPDSVSDEEAAFTVLAAIALQGVRLVNPTIGENIAVIGLGLIGLITVQLLIANGCRVLGIDLNEERLALAREFGAEAVNVGAGGDPVAAGMAFSDGQGIDAVIIAAATKSNDPMHQAAQMSRKRGRIVLVGVVGLSLSRADFYEKELTFQVSCSYGPGRYDEMYEQQGQDYPYGFVRWTEQRNFMAILDLMSSGKLDVAPLIARQLPQHAAAEAYRALTEEREALGIILAYPDPPTEPKRIVTIRPARHARASGKAVVGMIGAGNFTGLVLAPALAKTPAVLKTIASSGGTSATLVAQKQGFAQATSDYKTIIDDPEINTVFITTRHNSHARMTIEALQAGKHVFVEKPLALTPEELQSVREAYEKTDGLQLMVGFNRRFSPLAVRMHNLLQQRAQPISAIYTVNAGHIPANHWTQDPAVGGGRIIGEGCHFIDLLYYLIGAPLTGVEARMLGDAPGVEVRSDKMTILLDFADGSTGIVHYLSNGSKSFPKERVEIFSDGRVLVLDNFKSLQGYGWNGVKKERTARQDKGHQAEVAAFIERISTGGEALIPWQALEEVTAATFRAMERAQEQPRPL